MWECAQFSQGQETGGQSHMSVQVQPRLFAQVSRASATLLNHHRMQPGYTHEPSPWLPIPHAGPSARPTTTSSATSAPPLPASLPSSLHAPTDASAWQPTWMTSPYCVLSAAGVGDDFYMSCLAWGRHRVALALSGDVLLFDPGAPKTRVARAGPAELGTRPVVEADVSTPRGHNRDDGVSAAGAGGVHGEGRGGSLRVRRPTAVGVSRFADTACFVGFQDGGAALLAAAESGLLTATTHFALPVSPIASWVDGLLACGSHEVHPPGLPLDRAALRVPAGVATAVGTDTGAGAALARAAALLRASRASYEGITCVATTERSPSGAALGSSARGVFAVDARTPRLCTVFEPHHGPSVSPTASSPAPAARLRGVVAALRSTDRTCSVTYSATGALLAAGSGSGVVRVWSTTQPSRPLHVLRCSTDAAVKALAFHPTRPHELLVGRAAAGEHGLCVYDVGGPDPVLLRTAPTTAAVLQALYAPDGHAIVTAHGEGAARVSGAASPGSPPARRTTSLGLEFGTLATMDAAVAGDVHAHAHAHHTRGPTPTTTDPALVSYALAVWTEGPCGGAAAAARARLQRELLYTGGADPHSADGRARAFVREEEEEESWGADGGRGSGPTRPRQLRVRCVLPGHRSRPLHLAAPFSTSPLSLSSSHGGGDALGCVASHAGGEDGTVRFWRLFQRVGGVGGGGGGGVDASAASAADWVARPTRRAGSLGDLCGGSPMGAAPLR